MKKKIEIDLGMAIPSGLMLFVTSMSAFVLISLSDYLYGFFSGIMFFVFLLFFIDSVKGN